MSVTLSRAQHKRRDGSKPVSCEQCNLGINAGQEYICATGVYEGMFWRYLAHVECQNLKDAIVKEQKIWEAEDESYDLSGMWDDGMQHYLSEGLKQRMNAIFEGREA